MKMILLFSPVVLLIAGCAGMNSEPKSSYDRFTGTTINATRDNTLPNQFPEAFSVTLDMRQEITDGKTNYFFVVGSDSLNGGVKVPNYGESLFVAADNNHFAFSTDLKFQRTALGSRFFYPADPEKLKSIANSTNVEVRIIGVLGGRFERKLATKNVANFREFAEKYLP